MTKKDLIRELHVRMGLPASHIARVVDSILDLTKEAVAQGETVKVSGFGQFVVKQKEARQGRNPHTGEPITIPAHKALTFRTSKVLRDKVNGT
jgi:nucleoid DNA-binding protein